MNQVHLAYCDKLLADSIAAEEIIQRINIDLRDAVDNDTLDYLRIAQEVTND